MGITKKLMLVAVIVALIFWFMKRLLSRRFSLPPGPPSIPLLGAMPLIDSSDALRTFNKWADRYGKIYHFMMGRHDVVVLNDLGLCREIFSNELCQYRPQHNGMRRRKTAAKGNHCGECRTT